jgi:hypothetical protein
LTRGAKGIRAERELTFSENAGLRHLRLISGQLDLFRVREKKKGHPILFLSSRPVFFGK